MRKVILGAAIQGLSEGQAKRLLEDVMSVIPLSEERTSIRITKWKPPFPGIVKYASISDPENLFLISSMSLFIFKRNSVTGLMNSAKTINLTSIYK